MNPTHPPLQFPPDIIQPARQRSQSPGAHGGSAVQEVTTGIRDLKLKDKLATTPSIIQSQQPNPTLSTSSRPTSAASNTSSLTNIKNDQRPPSSQSQSASQSSANTASYLLILQRARQADKLKQADVHQQSSDYTAQGAPISISIILYNPLYSISPTLYVLAQSQHQRRETRLTEEEIERRRRLLHLEAYDRRLIELARSGHRITSDPNKPVSEFPEWQDHKPIQITDTTPKRDQNASQPRPTDQQQHIHTPSRDWDYHPQQTLTFKRFKPEPFRTKGSVSTREAGPVGPLTQYWIDKVAAANPILPLQRRNPVRREPSPPKYEVIPREVLLERREYLRQKFLDDYRFPRPPSPGRYRSLGEHQRNLLIEQEDRMYQHRWENREAIRLMQYREFLWKADFRFTADELQLPLPPMDNDQSPTPIRPNDLQISDSQQHRHHQRKQKDAQQKEQQHHSQSSKIKKMFRQIIPTTSRSTQEKQESLMNEAKQRSALHTYEQKHKKSALPSDDSGEPRKIFFHIRIVIFPLFTVFLVFLVLLTLLYFLTDLTDLQIDQFLNPSQPDSSGTYVILNVYHEFCYFLDTCAICRQPLRDQVVTLPCAHIFHNLCIRRWLRNKPTCPMCRTNLLP